MKQTKEQFANNVFYNAWDAVVTNSKSEYYHKIKRKFLDTLRAIAFKTHEDEIYGKYHPKQWHELVYLDRKTFERHLEVLEKFGLVQSERNGRLLKITVIDKFAPEEPKGENVIKLDDHRPEKKPNPNKDIPGNVPNPEWEGLVLQRNVFFREIIRKYPKAFPKIPREDKDISNSFIKYLLEQFDIEKYKGPDQNKDMFEAGLELRRYLNEEKELRDELKLKKACG